LRRFEFFFLVLAALTAVSSLASGQQSASDNVVVERVADTAFIQVRAPSFQALSPKQQA
jgi:hypothetical protein